MPESTDQLYFVVTKNGTTYVRNLKGALVPFVSVKNQPKPIKMETPNRPALKGEDDKWEKLFPGFSRLSKGQQEDFKKQMRAMDDKSWEYWTKPLASLGNKSRSQSYKFPMNCKENDNTSLNFGALRDKATKTTKDDTSHAGIDIYGNGGKASRDGNAEVRAATTGTIVFIGPKGYVPGTEAQHVQVVNDDGSIINYGEIVPENLKVGMRVSAGQTLGKTAKLIKQSMLHIEIYEGSQSRNGKTSAQAAEEAKKAYESGEKTDGTNFVTNISEEPSYTGGNKYNGNPFKRSKDLMNPTPFAALACS